MLHSADSLPEIRFIISFKQSSLNRIFFQIGFFFFFTKLGNRQFEMMLFDKNLDF